MMYHLFRALHEAHYSWFSVNPFQFITFRAAVAFVFALFTSLVLGPRVIAALRALKAGQPIRSVTVKDAPNLAEMHKNKVGTPTMGGVLIVASMLAPTLLFCDLLNPLVWLMIVVTLGYGSIGFLDDYLKITKRNADGLHGWGKIFGQVAIGLVVGGYLYFYGGTRVLPIEYAIIEGGNTVAPARTGYGYILLPFFKFAYPAIAWLFIPYTIFVLTAFSNAVNLTDGLDGLCIGISAIVTLALAVVTYLVSNKLYATYLFLPHVPRADELVVLLAGLLGACLGFLWFNAYPAEMFMGDTGSLTLGGVLGTAAIVTKQEFLLALMGGIFVLEALSVVIQVASYKTRRKRVFLMSPLHHHYEKLGVPESKIIARFWIVTVLFALVGLSSLKLR